jgi:hypothetical protein
MSHEHVQPPHKPKPGDEFGFTEREQLFDRVSHDRLMAFLDDSNTTIHRVEESSNSFGSFLFITLSKPGKDRRILVCFWGAGYHEGRERWIADEWFWHFSHPFPATLEQTVSHDEARRAIDEQRAFATAEATRDTQTSKGKTFEMLADLTDEDGAWADMQDLPWWLLSDEDE